MSRVDDLLLRVRRAQMRPAYRRRVLDGVPHVSGVGELRLLRAIERLAAPGARPSVGDIAVDLAVEHSTASRAVHEADRRGLVSKSPCQDDQRRSLVALTDEGHAALERATANRRRIIADVVAGWPGHDVARLIALLGRLVDGFDVLEHGRDG